MPDFLINRETARTGNLPPTTSTTPTLGEAARMTPKKFAESVLRVYEKLGGDAWLLTQAEADPRAFMTMLRQLLPKTIDLEDDGILVKVIESFQVSAVKTALTVSARPNPPAIVPGDSSRVEAALEVTELEFTAETARAGNHNIKRLHS